MREIAAELGLTAGSLYYYFASKDELVAYCQGATVDALLRLAGEVSTSRGSARDRLARWIEGHIVCLNETYPGSLAHLETGPLGREGPASELRSRRREYERLLSELIAAGVEGGEFRECEPRLTALALLGAMNWTVQWFDPEGSRSAREVGAEFASLFLRGLERSPP